MHGHFIQFQNRNCNFLKQQVISIHSIHRYVKIKKKEFLNKMISPSRIMRKEKLIHNAV